MVSNNNMNYFISCDWGTTSFRIRLVEKGTLKVLAASSNSEGIAQMFNKWKSGEFPETERINFYAEFLQHQKKIIEQDFASKLNDVPVIISGMVSSTIGMIELPYKNLPMNVDGREVLVEQLQDGKLIIVSGVKTEDDVLRGEETMLIGCDIQQSPEEHVYIFPGTHSKHIYVEDGIASGFNTYMTGEMFELLSIKSILSNSVAKPSEHEIAFRFFESGLEKAMKGAFLNDVFSVRTNRLLKNVAERDNFEYLSGIVIGHELKHLQHSSQKTITLVCNNQQKERYAHALKFICGEKEMAWKDADEALIRGHEIILEH